jgi:hypothetical protein
MLPIFAYNKNFYLFLIELMRKRLRERKTKIKEVKLDK